YANCGLTGQGHLNVYVRDGTTMTGGELLATGEENIGSSFTNSKLLVRVDIFWEDDYGPNYQFDSEHFIVLELENDGENAINLFFDTEEEQDDETRLIVKTNPVKDISTVTEAYDLETSNLEDLMPTDNFQPNLPVDFSKVFVSAQALNVFGTYDITEFKVTVFDSDDNELFVGNLDIEEPEDNSGTNDFEEITWNYNDPSEPSENHNGKGIYTVRVAAIDQQGNEFYIDKSIQMDAYGIYISTPQTQQSVALGGDIAYQLLVRNSGDENDKFTIEPSDTSDDWVVSPQTWTSNTLSPGGEQSVTFTVSAADSSEMVGKNTIVVFTGRSENSVTPVNFDLATTTTVGAAFEISMYFDDPSSGQAVTSFSANGVAGEWNQYQLSIANQGQATDSVQLISQEVPADWEIKFEYGDLNDATITVADIPRLGDGYNVANVTVWAKPAQGGEIDTASIKLIGISQGNTTKSDTATLVLTRSFGLSLSLVPQSSSGIFINKEAGQQFEVDLLLESAVEGDHTIQLYMGDNFPDGWSHSFKENGATVTEVSISGGDSKSLDLFITVGSQAVYKEDGDVFDVYAQDISDSSVVAKKQLTVILAYSGGFELSSLKYRETLAPEDSYTFQLTIENKANANDKFTLSATSVPSGWRVLFINGNVFEVEAGRTLSVPIKIEVSDEARDGDQESITISIFSDISNQEKQQSFVVDVEQGFTARLTTAVSDLWYIFVFFALIIVVGAISYNQQDDEDWDDEEEYESPSNPPSLELPNTADSSSDDEWDDWD
ncbi:MAG: FixG Ig-like domain-containing protein, partial [Candidatus Thermoplasmatota archaeon]|nr:FixG Ig-like domain-containing protein [Candidatus Thermoplasmatota archaeon]